ncbi:response regulator [Roseibacillus persicicus]|uniref:Response regulator n=1 Tax=Roseibacillus persicicus TaxID=454148 RepID=A0A918WJX1_9BACT|nr:response regulator [Roseibacillus persicicus]GHC53140.1 response regulator [Roseibacillus persicicus]
MAEDDEGHALLIERALRKTGINNPIRRFRDGQEFIDFCESQAGPGCSVREAFVLLLDIRMPKIDGVEVLRMVKNSERLRNLPVVMLTTTENPREVDLCHEIGCNAYIVKPVTPNDFTETIRSLGEFLRKMEVPSLAGVS